MPVKKYISTLALTLSVLTLPNGLQAASQVWLNTSSDQLWSTPANWSGNAVPNGATDQVSSFSSITDSPILDIDVNLHSVTSQTSGIDYINRGTISKVITFGNASFPATPYIASIGSGNFVINTDVDFSKGTDLILRSFNAAQKPILEFKGRLLNNTIHLSTNGSGNSPAGFAGTLKLTPEHGDNTTSIIVQNGTVVIGGVDIAAKDVTIGAEALLTGAGSISGNLTSEGKVSIGNSPGTLNVAGNVAFEDNSTFDVEFDATNFDKLIVGGTLTIGNNVELTLIALGGAGIFPENVTITHPVIEVPGGGITGSFVTTPFVFTNNDLFKAEIVQDANFINLIITNGSFAGVVSQVADGNANRLGSLLDDFINNNTQSSPLTDFENIVSFLQVATISQLEDALDQIQPSIALGLMSVQEENAIAGRKAAMLRIRELLAGRCPIGKGHTNFWGTIGGGYLEQQSLGDYKGFRAVNFNKRLGVDSSNTENLIMGMSASFSHNKVDWKENGGDGQINAIQPNLYLSRHGEVGFVNAIVEGGFSWYKQNRKLDFLNFERGAQGSSTGVQGLVHVDAALYINQFQFQLRPYGSIDYIVTKRRGFTETGANSLNATVGKTKGEMFRGEAGIEFGDCTTWKALKLALDGKVAAAHESRHNKRMLSYTLPELLTSTNSFGITPDRTFAIIEMGLTGQITETLFAKILYSGEMGGKYDNHTGEVRIGGKF